MNNIEVSQGEMILSPKEQALAHLFEIVQHNQTSSLVGRFLTIIESSISDPVQREAIKSVTKQISYNEGRFSGKLPYGYLAKMLLEPEQESKSTLRASSDYDIWVEQFRNA